MTSKIWEIIKQEIWMSDKGNSKGSRDKLEMLEMI